MRIISAAIVIIIVGHAVHAIHHDPAAIILHLAMMATIWPY
jgi:hypothetical protein